MAVRWRTLSDPRRRELHVLQAGRVEGIRLVPMPAMGREPENRRFSAFLTAHFDGRLQQASAHGRSRREGTVSVELELFLPPDFPVSPPILHCHTPGLKHWSVDRGGRIGITQLIEWSPKIQLTSLLQHVRQNLLREMELSPQREAHRRSPSPQRGATLTPALANAMSGDWRAAGHSDGSDAKVAGFQEELEEFTLDVRADGHVTGYPTFDVERDDVFSLSGSVKPDNNGRLCLEMRQDYPHTGGVTNWAARVGDDGTTLTHGRWSGSCAGTFDAERVREPVAQTTSLEKLQAAHRAVVAGPEPEPEPGFESATASAERESLLWELARSEDKYTKDLQSLITYRTELKKQLPREDLESLFPGLDEIVALSYGFDDELNDSLGSCQDANAALAVRRGGVCSLFINLIPQMKCYQGYVQSFLSTKTSELLVRPEVTDTVARVAAAGTGMPRFDVLRMAPVRRLESYKACFAKLLQLTERTAPEYRDIREINASLDALVERHISPRKATADQVSQGDLQKIRRAQREKAEQLQRRAYGNPPSYNGKTRQALSTSPVICSY
eukprot:COSAG03_NODE_511_length_7294_cov_23.887021_7_plen_557_part_00